MMQNTFHYRQPLLRHSAALPWLCYDQNARQVIIRLVSSPDVKSVRVFYGDPFDYGDSGGFRRWHYRSEAMSVQYGDSSSLVWRIALELPQWRRMKYAFCAESPIFCNGESGGQWYFSENGLVPFIESEIHESHNHFFYPFIHEVDAPLLPQWAGHTVWYQIFPERFCRGNAAISPPGLARWDCDEPTYRNFFGGDLEGVRQKLGYLKDLGISGVYLTPVFQAPSNHKYDTEDYFRIDEHFGDTQTLKALVREAHALGIRVMLDAVFNHAGSRHPFWQDVLKNQENSAYKDYFHIKNFPVREHYDNNRQINYDCFAFSPAMPKWNTENPHVRRYLTDAAVYWIRECDIDAWRLDVANEVSFDFWREFSAAIHLEKKDFYVIGEVWNDASPWVSPLYFDGAMNYPLGTAISAFFLQKTVNADTFTVRLFRSLSLYSDPHNRIAFNLLDSHDTERSLTRARGDKQALRNAFTMLFLLPGSPCVYYGTETGMTGGHDPQCRRPMVWDAQRQDSDLFAFFQRLIRFRMEHIELIAESAIAYSRLEGAHCWTLSPAGGKGAALGLVYAKGSPVPMQPLQPLLGTAVFSTADKTNAADYIPPYTVMIFCRDGM